MTIVEHLPQLVEKLPDQAEEIVDCLLQLLQTDVEKEYKQIVDVLQTLYEKHPKSVLDSVFSCFIHSEKQTLLRQRVVKYMHKYLSKLISRDSDSRKTQANGLLKFALKEASIAEWERLVLLMKSINRRWGSDEVEVEILSFAYLDADLSVSCFLVTIFFSICVRMIFSRLSMGSAQMLKT
jgi:hypothetical protein